ncbi:MAG: 3-isopropylmalate dehydratase large subunit [Gammaproteobacteria bacterium]|nr:3-isopropylmalate dehydratase large subunit [Gammaproteobacteria bacterium]
MHGKTLYDKLWEAHVVCPFDDGTALVYIDRHIAHEVTTPQAFEALKLAGRGLWRARATKAVSDHNVPTRDVTNITDPIARKQLDMLSKNCAEHGITHHDIGDVRQGIVHVTGPEQGWSLPGMTIVCGDSHTATNGALAALAFGIGSSEVEHVMATQCLILRKAKNMRITINGALGRGVTPKDLVLHIIGVIGTAGATGHTLEYAGETIASMSMEGRMTVCNMSIEAGGRAGMMAFDDTTRDFVKGRPYAPDGALWDRALAAWQDLHSDPDAVFDREIAFDAAAIEPQVSWGTSPEMVVAVNGVVPDPAAAGSEVQKIGMQNALRYMDLAPGTRITEISIDKVFIGSCTNSRIEDLRAAAEVVKGRQRAANVNAALVVPGSGLVKQQAEAEGLDQVFLDAGFEWREPGCSMCLGMNPDQLGEGERCASTSNRNFEGRQGRGGRTHLVSPAMAAAAGVAGHFVDVRDL